MPLPQVLELVGRDLELVGEEFQRRLYSQVPLIPEVGGYLFNHGGKRLRPALLLLSAGLCGYRGERRIPLAAMIEALHTATLLHDDVVDEATLRRGERSANAVWGNPASVLVGDFLLSTTFSTLVDDGDLRILEVVSRATTKMAEAEVAQLINTADIDLSEEDYTEVIVNKTATLISVATRIGAILGEVDEEQEEALSSFGLKLGVAFQLTDDNLDYIAREGELGKTIGHDLADGKVTLPLIHTLRQCRPEEREELREIVLSHSDALGNGHLQRAKDLIDKYEGIDYTRSAALRYAREAKGKLSSFPWALEKDALTSLADYAVARVH